MIYALGFICTLVLVFGSIGCLIEYLSNKFLDEWRARPMFNGPIIDVLAKDVTGEDNDDGKKG
jgi:hypothetical protein